MERYFIAIDITDNMRDKIYHLSKYFSKYGQMVNLKPENLHITLKFLGNIDKINDIVHKLEQTQMNAFTLKLENIGYFIGTDNKLRIIWIDITRGSDKCVELNKKISDILNLKDNRAYIPHLTISRVKNYDNKLLEVLKTCKNKDFGELHVNKFVLYESKLTPKGPIYTPIKEFTLS